MLIFAKKSVGVSDIGGNNKGSLLEPPFWTYFWIKTTCVKVNAIFLVISFYFRLNYYN